MKESAWDRIANEAGARFVERGYDAVGLREIADALEIKAASLYYHCKGGKPELYTRALEDVLARHRASLDEVGQKPDLAVALQAMAAWMLEQRPIDMHRIVHVDLPALGDPALQKRLSSALHLGVHRPFAQVFKRAQERGELRDECSVDVLAATALALISGLGFIHLPPPDQQPTRTQRTKALALVEAGLNLLLHGALARR